MFCLTVPIFKRYRRIAGLIGDGEMRNQTLEWSTVRSHRKIETYDGVIQQCGIR